MHNPYESFYHGLVVSKLWLCEELEKILDNDKIIKPSVVVLGGWHNLISFMMVIRRPKFYNEFNSYDKDPDSTDVAYKICDAWKFEEPKIHNHTVDACTIDFKNLQNTIFINCSVDQFENNIWYDNIPKGSLVCVQTTDIIDENPLWEINQRTKDINEFKQKFKLNQLLFSGVKEIKYGDKIFYNRLMLIGYK